MKFKMFSVVTGTEACIAHCPFCVSREDFVGEYKHAPAVNWRNFNIACELANRSNIDTVMLTSRGEPLLFPEQLTMYLQELRQYRFPFIELQTNGILLDNPDMDWKQRLKTWYELGLTTVTLSVVSDDYEKNKNHYLNGNGQYMSIPSVVELLHRVGLSVRLTCVLCEGIASTPEEVAKFIEFAKSLQVEQVTLRPVNMEYRRESAGNWIKDRLLSDTDKTLIRNYLEDTGTKLLELDRIGTIYDVKGQNVMFSVPLTKYTRDCDPENLRNLIFFPDGHIRYEWEMEGGILL